MVVGLTTQSGEWGTNPFQGKQTEVKRGRRHRSDEWGKGRCWKKNCVRFRKRWCSRREREVLPTVIRRSTGRAEGGVGGLREKLKPLEPGTSPGRSLPIDKGEKRESLRKKTSYAVESA